MSRWSLPMSSELPQASVEGYMGYDASRLRESNNVWSFDWVVVLNGPLRMWSFCGLHALAGVFMADC